MRTSALFGEKTSDFSKFMVCPHCCDHDSESKIVHSGYGAGSTSRSWWETEGKWQSWELYESRLV